MGQEGMDVRPSDPREVDCEFCTETAVKAVPLRKRPGTFMYVCGQHIQAAEAVNLNKPRGEK